jgi:threonine dehydrogenase-like Zn-dependent dehydrogenase
MRAAIFRKGDIVVDTLPDPVPGEGQVLVKTLACGICGSDLHARQHAPRMVALTKRIPWRKPMDLDRDVVFGHEYCCEVLDYGPGTTRRLKRGTHVCSMPAIVRSGALEGIGYSNDNVGGYAERMLLSEALLLAVPNGLSPDYAALTEPLAVGVHAVEKAGVKGGEVALVIGCGPVGLAVIAALRLKGVRPIIATDYSPKRRELAKRMGADVLVDPRTASPYQTWEQHAALPVPPAGSLPPLLGARLPQKPALIFECVGVPGVIQQVLEGAPRDARVVVVGVCMESDQIEPTLGIMKEIGLQFVLGYTPDEFQRSLRLIADGAVDARTLITDKVGLDGVKGAFTALANPEKQTKILVEPWR